MRDGQDWQHPEQRSYLIRLWRTNNDGPLRVTLIAIAPQAPPRHFADLDMLLEFLLAEPPAEQTQDDRHNHCTADEEE